MKMPKQPKPSNNHPDKMINELLVELDKFTHYTRDQMDLYYFIKRLQLQVTLYKKFISQTTKQVARAVSSIENQKRINKTRKEKK